MKNWRRAGIALTACSLLIWGASASADPGQWQGPQTVDDDVAGSLQAVVANASGVFGVLYRGRFEVAHRRAGDKAPWSEPQPLAGSGDPLLEGGPVMALPSGAAVVFATVAAAERTFMWRVSKAGTPGPRQVLPFDSFTPQAADRAADGRWLVAGTRSGVPGPARMAIRSSSGSWRVSQRLPLGRAVLGGAWFDREGVPHVLVASARTSGPGHPISESRLRPDGSWSTPHQIGKVEGTYVSVVANTDGDVTMAYSHRVNPSRLNSIVRTRPYGGAWSAPLRLPRGAPSIAIDAAGRTVVVETGREVSMGRIGPGGSLVDGWQQLTSETFDNYYLGRQALSSGSNGVAVVGVVGDETSDEGTSRIERFWRCVPGEDCAEVGDFDLGPDGFGHTQASGPAGTVYALNSTTPPCETAGTLCSWRLPGS